ncbi:MAG: phosphotransferase, partial [Nocardioides sp.]
MERRSEGTGRTDAVVRRSPDGPAYAKSGTGRVRDELVDERDRLEWLAETDLPAPRVLDWADDGESATLTTTALPGVPLSDLPATSAEAAARSLGAFLARLHTLDTRSCPFERWLAVTVPL